jgi:hypothetical protein
VAQLLLLPACSTKVNPEHADNKMIRDNRTHAAVMGGLLKPVLGELPVQRASMADSRCEKVPTRVGT